MSEIKSENFHAGILEFVSSFRKCKILETEFRPKYVPFSGPFFRTLEESSLFFSGEIIA